MYKKIIWPLLVVISLVLTVVFVTGSIIALNISTSGEPITEADPNITQTPIPNINPSGEDGLDIVVLGDSIGFGIGDEGNQGVGKRYAALVDPKGEYDIQVTNLSVSGAVVAELEALVNRTENAASISLGTLIILSIGGNDLNRLQNQDPSILDIEYEETLKAYKEDLQAILKRIRDINPDVQLALVGLYDPYNSDNPQKTRLLLDWNYETRRMVYEDPQMVYIPTYEVFQYHLDEYLAFDGFHPSSAGYKVISEMLYDIINGTE